jgi:hypothetical protein
MIRHSEVNVEKQNFDWFRAGFVAFVFTIVVHIFRTIPLVHNAGADVAEGLEIVAVLLTIGCFLRWAVVRERAR